jgi:hypothetical protein
MPQWTDPPTGLADALEAWALALYGVHLAHPWLTERQWSAATQGPNEQDWLERLLLILDRFGTAPPALPVVVTTIYATVRATAQTDAAYRRMAQRDAAQWLAQARATATLLPDFARRYPLSTGLEPLTPNWADNPRAALIGAVRLLAAGLDRHAGQ